jgi:hypothetical protein
MIPQIGLCSAIVLSVLFGSTYPASAESYRVCIGQYEHKCPAAKDAWFKCRTSIQSAGVGPGSVFVLPTPMRHDLENTGKETLRAVAFFSAAMFTQDFDQVMMPPKSHILGTPNREG